MAYSLLFDGFDSYPSEDISLYWPMSYNVMIGASGSGRNSTKGICTGGGFESALVSPVFPPSSHVVFGFAYKNSGYMNNSALIFRQGAVNQVALNFTELRQFSIAGLLSTQQYPVGTWCYVEVGVVFGDVGSVEVRVNGSPWIVQTTVDTKVGSATGIDNVIFFKRWDDMWIDDIYIAYGDELKWLGDCRVDSLALTGNSTPQDWTVVGDGDAYALLNAGTGHIESATDEATSMFDFANLSYTPVAIHALQVRGKLRKSDVGYREAALVIKSGNAEVESTTLPLSTDSLVTTKLFLQDPATSAPWLRAGIEAAKIGVRVKV